MPQPSVLVTGATGAVGPAVVRAFVSAGYSVRTLSTTPPAADALPPGVDVRVGDVCDANTVRSAVAGVDVIAHLAALLHHFGPDAAPDAEYERVNIGGTENIVYAATRQGVSRVVFLSTIAVYGATSGQVVDETTLPRPNSMYGLTKFAAEQLVLTGKVEGKSIGTVLRSAAAYGSHIKGNYLRLATAIARGRFVPIGSGANRRTLIHEHDLASAVVLAARHPAAAGWIFNVSDGHVHTLADVIDAIHRAAGRRPPRLHVPMVAARAVTAVSENTARFVGLQPPITRSALEKYTEDVAVDATLIQRMLGFVPCVDLLTGWQETLVHAPGLKAGGRTDDVNAPSLKAGGRTDDVGKAARRTERAAC